jgi:hypothetical protein
MPDHRAEQILAAVQTSVTGLTTTGQNVDRGRAEEIPVEKLPALRVAMGEDPIVDPWAQSLLDSELDVSVFGLAHDSAANVETKLLQIRKEVTIALMANQTLGLAFVHALVELGARKPILTGDLAKPAGAMEMRFRVKYRRSRTDPSA